MKLKRTPRVFFPVFLLLLTTSCSPGRPEAPIATFPHPQRMCAGRLRFIVPGPNAALRYILANINGADVNWTPLPDRKAFDAAWTTRKQAILAANNILVKPLPQTATQVGIVTHPDNDLKSYTENPWNDIEVWRYAGNGAFQVRFGGAETKRLTDALYYVQHVADAFVPQQDIGSVSPGFCIEGGRILFANPVGEGIDVNITIPLQDSTSVVVLNVSTDQVKNTEHDVLLERIDKNRTKSLTQKILRHGDRTVAGLQGHEYVVTDHDLLSSGKFTFAAYFEVGGIAEDSYQPRLRLRIDPTYFPTSIDPQHLLALWDAILSSITLPQ